MDDALFVLLINAQLPPPSVLANMSPCPYPFITSLHFLSNLPPALRLSLDVRLEPPRRKLLHGMML